MKEASIFREFLRYVSLNVCGMIGLSGYIFADTFFVSKGLGADGLAALNLAIPVYSFVHGSGLMLGMGGATKYSVLMGQKEHCQGDQLFSNVVYFTGILAAAFLLVGGFLAGKLTLWLGADQAVFSMTETYLRVILFFAPAFMLNDVLVCFVRNDGEPKLSMAAMLTGSLSNIMLDYLFIFPLHMGILGAVLATAMAPLISIGVLSRHWTAKRNQFHFKKARIVPELAAHIFSLGVPSLITEVASGIVMIVFNSLILRLEGNLGVAAYGVVANLSLVVTSIYTGIAQGAQPILSRFYGRGNTRNTKKILKYAVLTTLLLSGCIYLLFVTAADPIAGVFNSGKNHKLQQIAVTGLRLYFTAVPFVGFNIILSAYYTSTEKALPAQILSLSRGFFIILPMAFLLSFLWGMTGVWFSYLITESIVTAVGILFYIRFERVSQV